MKNHKIKFLFFVAIFIVFGFGSGLETKAISEGETRSFNINPSYDLYSRDEISAYLIRTTNSLYFYIEKSWWESRSVQEQNDIRIALFNLGEEFNNKIYPALTSNFGFEWRPGIDKDSKITILMHPMKEGSGGYFNSGDEYSRIQNPNSNEREMVYLNTFYITDKNAKSYLAHEFMHLITFNQKDKINGVTEEIWLNELRAEYAPTLLGYDDVYEGSILQKRVNTFLVKPSDSLTGWKNKKEDYGVLNLFAQYLVEHYGAGVLSYSLKTSKVGITSINEALFKMGFKEDFSQIFSNWTIANFINNCQIDKKYCYSNPNLSNLRIVAPIYFLSQDGDSSFFGNYSTEEWAGNWYKIIGGKGDLAFEFDGSESVSFKFFYLLCDHQGVCNINFLNLDSSKNGKIIINDFNIKYASFIIMPSIHSVITTGLSYNFSLKITASNKITGDSNEDLINKLLVQIEYLKKEIARLQSQQNSNTNQTSSCGKFTDNLYFGMTGNTKVACLQQFLKSQGADIYPQGLVTGNFLSLTRSAVIRFQEKYRDEILKPLGLEKGTGYFGPSTRVKVNQLMSL